MKFTAEKDGFILTTDKAKLDIISIHQYLSTEAYWCKNVSIEIVKRSIDGSMCFGIFHGQRQVGFARVITDTATFGYLADVFIINDYRGRGLAKWLMQCIMGHSELQGFRSWMLATRDAHGLYSQFGFKPLEKPERIMRYGIFTEYPAMNENK